MERQGEESHQFRHELGWAARRMLPTVVGFAFLAPGLHLVADAVVSAHENKLVHEMQVNHDDPRAVLDVENDAQQTHADILDANDRETLVGEVAIYGIGTVMLAGLTYRRHHQSRRPNQQDGEAGK